MVALGLLCVVAGAALVAAGEWLGALAVLPFGAVLVATGRLRPPAEGSTEGIRYVEQPVRGTAFTVAPRTARLTSVSFAGFTLASIGMIASGEAVVTGIFGLIVFGGIGALTVPAMLRGESHPILTPDGIHQRSTFVPWDAIEGWSIYEVRGIEMLALAVDRSRVRVPRAARVLFGLNRRLGGGEITVPLSNLAADGDLLVQVVERVLEHHEDRPLLASPGGPEAVSRLTAAG